eukprot:3126371-Amphidinium_carterae.1
MPPLPDTRVRTRYIQGGPVHQPEREKRKSHTQVPCRHSWAGQGGCRKELHEQRGCRVPCMQLANSRKRENLANSPHTHSLAMASNGVSVKARG